MEEDSVKLWYSMLRGRNHVWMTKEDCNSGQAMTVKGWLQGALKAIDAGYGRRGKAVGKAVGECRQVMP